MVAPAARLCTPYHQPELAPPHAASIFLPSSPSRLLVDIQQCTQPLPTLSPRLKGAPICEYPAAPSQHASPWLALSWASELELSRMLVSREPWAASSSALCLPRVCQSPLIFPSSDPGGWLSPPPSSSMTRTKTRPSPLARKPTLSGYRPRTCHQRLD